jgi:hypothetical protein
MVVFFRAFTDNTRAKVVGQPADGGEGAPQVWISPSGTWRADIPYLLVYDKFGKLMEDTTAPPNINTLPSIIDVEQSDEPTLTDANRAISASGN